jgi:hypothetical protein
VNKLENFVHNVMDFDYQFYFKDTKQSFRL